MKGDRLSAPGRFRQLDKDHPAVRNGQICSVCAEPMRAGQVPALVELGPADETEADKAARGKPYVATAEIVHESCAPAERV
jgi:hypothetical protein